MYTPQCEGCKRVVEVLPTPGNACGLGCQNYSNPRAQWRRGNCAMATHVTREKEDTGKVRLGQQKQKKFR